MEEVGDKEGGEEGEGGNAAEGGYVMEGGEPTRSISFLLLISRTEKQEPQPISSPSHLISFSLSLPRTEKQELGLISPLSLSTSEESQLST